MKFYSSKVRSIGVTTRSVSGVVPSIGSYESTLERDFMELTRFEDAYKELVPQPITIGYINSQGKPSQYTPDGLITFRNELEIAPILYEIKYREDFRGSWRTLLPKFRAAKQYAFNRGWVFKVYTEREIRTQQLMNIKFLWPFKHRQFEEPMLNYILKIMSDLQEADPALLASALFSSQKQQAQAIPAIWYLIATSRIGCNLDKPLTMHSRIWTKEDL